MVFNDAIGKEGPETAKPGRIDKLLAIIPVGRENARSMQELAEVLGIDARTLRQLIVDAAKEGNLIAGDSHGYYLAANMEEVKGFYDLMATRQKTTAVRLEPFEKVMKEGKDRD